MILDYALSCVLLFSPGELANQHYPEYWHLMPIMQAIAVDQEIMDKREERYILNREIDFAADVKVLRERYQSLKDVPRISDALRLPSRDLTNELMSFNRAYRQQIEAKRGIWRAWAPDIDEAIKEADQLYQIWDSIRDARSELYYITVRRQALKQLRDKLGAEGYDAGVIPPFVPVWRFSRKD